MPEQTFGRVVAHLGDYIYFQQAAGVGQSDMGPPFLLFLL
jgi:hypothetical protein